MTWFINAQKEAGLRPAAVEAWDDWTKKRVELYEAYEAQCQREGVVDFAELLLRSYELLERNEPLRRHYQERFRHILVDEFQDTNKLQYRWLKLLAGGGAALFCVGDDDQSIYAFRGADVGNMRDFEREFKVQNMIRLEQNYRSHGNILDAANAIIKNNPSRLGKNLWTEAGAGEPIRVHESYSDVDEARFIVEEVKALASEGHARAEMALLYRSNAQSRAPRTCAVQRRPALPRVWRPALLRARRDQARARLPATDRQYRRRHGLCPRGEFPDARHRRAQHRTVGRRREGAGLKSARRNSVWSPAPAAPSSPPLPA